MVAAPASPTGRRRTLAAALLLAGCLATLALARIGLISHRGAGAVAEFDYLRIYQP